MSRQHHQVRVPRRLNTCTTMATPNPTATATSVINSGVFFGGMCYAGRIRATRFSAEKNVLQLLR